MGAACAALGAYGMARLAEEEMALAEYARQRLANLPGVELYALWDTGAPRLGILAFNVEGYWHSQVAAILSAEYGIGVRHGCFCAHPLVLHLLRIGSAEAAAIRGEIAGGNRSRVPGAVRASMGLGTRRADIDALHDALAALVARGPQWRYRLEPETGEYLPEPDTRQWPMLPLALAGATGVHGESS